MKLEKIKFENFRKLSHNEVKFPNIPILILFDHNGRGKTSIQEGVLWGLAGEIFRFESISRKSEFASIDAIFGLRSSDKSRINVTLEFGGNGSSEFVTRVDRPKRKKSYLTSSQKEDQRYYINDISVDKDEFIDEIHANLGLHPFDFQTTNFLSQEIINEALVTDENIRANVFSKILSFDWMQEISDRVSEEIQTLRSYRKMLMIERTQITSKLDKTELNEIWTQLQKTQNSIESQGLILGTSGKIEYSDYIDRLESGFKLQKDNTSIEKLNERISSQSHTKFENLAFKDLKLFQSELQNNLNTDRESIGKLKSHKAVSSSSIEDLVKLIKDFKLKEKSLTKMEVNVKKLKTNFEEESKKIQEQLKKTETQVNKFGDLEKLFVGKQEIDSKIEELETKYGNFSIQNEKSNQINKSKKGLAESLNNLSKFKTELQPKINERKQLVLKVEERRDNSKKYENLDFNLIISNISNSLDQLGHIQPHIDEEILDNKITNNINKFVSIQRDELLNSKDEIWEFQNHLASFVSSLQTNPFELKEQQITNYINLNKSKELSSKNIENIDGLIKEYTNKLEEKNIEMDELNLDVKKLSELQNNISSTNDLSKFIIPILGIFAVLFFILFVTAGNPSFLAVGIISLLALIFLIKPDLIVKKPNFVVNQGMFFSQKRRNNALNKLSKEIGIKIEFLENEKSELNIKIKEFEIQSITLQKENSGDFDLSDVIMKDPTKSKESYSDLRETIYRLKTQVDELHNYHLSLDSILRIKEIEKKIKLIEDEIIGKSETKLKNISGQEIKLTNFQESQSMLDKMISGININLQELEGEERETSGRFSELKSELKKLGILKKNVKEDHKIEIDQLEDAYGASKKDKITQENSLSELKQTQNKILADFNVKKTELESTKSGIKTLKTGIYKQLTSIGIKKETLGLEESEISKIIQSSQFDVEKDFQQVESRIKQVEKLDQELKTLNSFFDQRELILNKWNKHQKLVEDAENNIFVLNSKLDNIEELENALKKVTKGVKSATEQITNEIINTVKHDVFEYFKELGGHDTLDFLDLSIKHIRGKLKVEIKVGMDKRNSGAPKALFSNGEQVVLVLALFFAVTKNLLENSKFKWIGLDEPTQYLDSERKELFTKFLTDFSNNHPETQIFLTTADAEFINYVEDSKFKNLMISEINDLVTTKFSETHFPEIRLKAKKKVRKKKRIRKKIDDRGLLITKVEDLKLPHTSKSKGKPLPAIDVIMEGKENKCSICRKTFRAMTYKSICDESNCIAEYKKAMFNL